jgi:GT2 family glycosyltransferase
MNDITQPQVSVVVLTYSRPDEIKKNIAKLLGLSYEKLEIIVVDNASEIPVVEILPQDDRLIIIRLDENLGVGGRNKGILKASSEIVITLDDDVTGLTDEFIVEIVNQFNAADIAAINFKVIDEKTKEITNWCHHRKQEIYSNQSFDTYEISEGAVAFRKNSVVEAGLYSEYLFISHEGPDLAIRLMDLGCKVIYCPNIVVMHSHCQIARLSWRRYYYDTRNVIWLAVRSFPFFTAANILAIGVFSMFAYSIRDGYFRYWCKGIFDAVLKIGVVINERKVISRATLSRYKEIGTYNSNILYLIKKRLFNRGVKI